MKKILKFLALLPLVAFNYHANTFYPPPNHCAKKEMSDKHHSKIRLRLHYLEKNSPFNSYGHVFWKSGNTTPIYNTYDDNGFEDPGQGNTLCYEAQDSINKLDGDDVVKLIDVRVEVQRGFDCENWSFENQYNVFGELKPKDAQYNKIHTQKYVLRHFHYGIHTHCIRYFDPVTN